VHGGFDTSSFELFDLGAAWPWLFE
jgi:hypothetical protein